jgi:murein DD-endopeptidase MepM/ murein hydrolase activator NlpD
MNIAALALLLAATGGAVLAQAGNAAGARLPGGVAPSGVLLAPERLRQGDPLVVWALSGTDIGGAEARLVDAADEEGKRSHAAARAFGGPELSAPAGTAAPAPDAAQPAAAAPVIRAYGFMMAIPTGLPPGAYRIYVALPGGAELSAPLELSAREFPSEDIALDEANSRLRTESDPRKIAEALRLYEILGRADADAVYLDGSAFMMPIVPRRKSAGFGDRRRYLYQGGGSDAGIHAGVDLAAATGTEVWATAPGRVVLTADRAVTGLTVVLEHLPGLYSLYMHLSEISVREGEVLERGAKLGRSGSTGLSTGPHLHWELRAAGQAVDPEYWLSRPPLDKDRAAAIIAGLIEGR